MTAPVLLPALLSALRCPACQAQRWTVGDPPTRLACAACGHAHHIANGILHINVPKEHEEVIQERASVPATEMSPELGGWSEAYTAATDPSSSLAQAYLSLPHGNDSSHFRQPGYFQNVRRFAPEFDFIRRHVPHHGLLLDLGADGTWSTAQLARHGPTCIALDITDHLALAHLFQTASPRYGLVNADMHEAVFADGAFDVVTAFNALHHSKRLDALAANIARMLKPGGMLGIVEPYVQNAQQEADFGVPQSAVGINENVHTVDRWHGAFSQAGLHLAAIALSDSFNAVYVRTQGPGPRDQADPLADFYDAALQASPASVTVAAGEVIRFQVTVESRGRAAWASRGPVPVRLSYHLSRITPEGRVMVAFDNERALLTDFVGAGAPAGFDVPVRIDEAGAYEIEFDLVHETRCWFKERGARTAQALVNAV